MAAPIWRSWTSCMNRHGDVLVPVFVLLLPIEQGLLLQQFVVDVGHFLVQQLQVLVSRLWLRRLFDFIMLLGKFRSWLLWRAAVVLSRVDLFDLEMRDLRRSTFRMKLLRPDYRRYLVERHLFLRHGLLRVHLNLRLAGHLLRNRFFGRLCVDNLMGWLRLKVVLLHDLVDRLLFLVPRLRLPDWQVQIGVLVEVP